MDDANDACLLLGLELPERSVLGAILNNLDLHQYGYTYRKSYYDYYESSDDEQKRKTV